MLLSMRLTSPSSKMSGFHLRQRGLVVVSEISQTLFRLLYQGPQLLFHFRQLRAGPLSTVLRAPTNSPLGRGLMSRKFSRCSMKLSTSAISQELPKEGNSRQMGGRGQNDDAPATAEDGRVLGVECLQVDWCHRWHSKT
ncbi:hypothetical protein PGIGA_G00048840 [Pangasianodon gigas]|uniref:Uncharacterized protein n=1 Tax=Pangasianodon gigas TaxID=30993 RepID=A0ACC5X1W2_PANGG|nr:hypothetical protein [Pangasianodon gigas]